MVATQRTQSLTDFRQRATETLDRLNKTGEAEILTVNGEARAVLLSPAVFDELAREAQLNRDVSVIRRAMQQVEAGEQIEASEFFKQMRRQLKSRAAKTRRGAR